MLETIYYKTKTILPLHVSQHTVFELTSTIFHIYIGHCNHAVEERRNSERRNAEPNRKDDVITREWEQEDWYSGDSLPIYNKCTWTVHLNSGSSWKYPCTKMWKMEMLQIDHNSRIYPSVQSTLKMLTKERKTCQVDRCQGQCVCPLQNRKIKQQGVQLNLRTNIPHI